MKMKDTLTADMIKNKGRADLKRAVFFCKYELGLNPNRPTNLSAAKGILELLK